LSLGYAAFGDAPNETDDVFLRERLSVAFLRTISCGKNMDGSSGKARVWVAARITRYACVDLSALSNLSNLSNFKKRIFSYFRVEQF
jgi:hypothetical protein